MVMPLGEVAAAALAASRAAHCAVVADDTEAAWLRWADQDVTGNGSRITRAVTVISTLRRAEGTGVGTVSRTVRDAEGVVAAVRASEAAAEQAPSRGPRSPRPLGAGGARRPVAGAAAVPDGCQDEIASVAPRIAAWRERAPGPLSGFGQRNTVRALLATSEGLWREHVQRTATMEVSARAADGSAPLWAGAAAARLDAVDLAALERATSEPHRRPLPRRTLPAGRYEVILSPSAVADLMIVLYRAAGAADAAEGRTVFGRPGGGTRLGTRLAALPLTLRGAPGEPGLECCPFVLSRGAVSDVFGDAVQAGAAHEDNGLALESVEWISRGMLASLLAGRADAAGLGLPVRPAIGNLILEGGDGAAAPSGQEMVRATRRGLLVNCLWYMRPTDSGTLSLTGVTRDGVFLVEDGRVTARVNDFRFAESPVSLLDRATEVGRTERTLAREFGAHFPRTAMPHLRIPDFLLTAASADA
ncbi:metallopeptidase TldD-related protein [Streptomyces sp. NPDC047046]|uniref:metallopeptidase TldD-related protein n=1 Tax=Streptomyces sp. NPDC047046 TaxID=3155378 RepID=UPI0033D72211